jgi:plasmid stability protein
MSSGEMMTEHRYANTTAALMLAAGLRSAAQERNLSLREIGRRLSYRQPVVLSHMATGRVPIPVNRAADIAREVGIPPNQFIQAVLHQHHPQIEWGLITGKVDPFLLDLQQAAGKPLAAVGAEHRRILKEVVKDQKPEERWLSIPEIAAIRFLRELFPNMQTCGLSEEERDALRLAVELRAEHTAEGDYRARIEGKKNES